MVVTKNVPDFVYHIDLFFSIDDAPIGSFERLSRLHTHFFNTTRCKYLIAGSWAIEAISGQVLEHDDIDIIVLSNPPFYVDDAITQEEHCCHRIPLPLDYLGAHTITCVLRNTLPVLVPSINMQLCLKLIGQLERKLPKRAIHQAFAILSQYTNPDYAKIKSDCVYLVSKLTPADFNIDEVVDTICLAITSYTIGDVDQAELHLRNAHSIINRSLHNTFEMMHLE